MSEVGIIQPHMIFEIDDQEGGTFFFKIFVIDMRESIVYGTVSRDFRYQNQWHYMMGIHMNVWGAIVVRPIFQ